MPEEDALRTATSIRVLLVDDEEGQMELTKLSLENADPTLTITITPKPFFAVRLLSDQPFDCIVSDYQMPEMNGIQLCIEVKKTRTIPFIVYTARGSEEVAEKAFSVGVDDYVRKEMELSHFKILAKRIRHAVEKNRAEVALQNSRDQLNSMMERITDNFVALDPEWRYVYANDSALRTLRKTREEIIGRLVWDVFPDLAGTIYGEKYREAMEKQVPIEFEAYYRPLDMWTYMKIFPSPQGLTIYYQDVSNRKKAEEELRRLASFPQLNPNPIVEADLSGKIHYTNPAAASTFPALSWIGSTAPLVLNWEETVAQLWREEKKILMRDVEINGVWYSLSLHMVLGADRVRIYATNIDERKRYENALETSYVRLRKSGEELAVINEELRTSDEELRSSNEELVATEQELRVSNERVQEYTNRLEGMVEERTVKLRESEERLRAFMDSTDMGFALYDSELHLLDLNRVALGWALMNSPPGTVKENIIGKSISEVFPGIEKTEVYAALEKVIETGESIPMEGVSSVSDEMWMLSSAFRVGSGFGVICRDISRRRKLQEALQRAEVISAVEQMGATVAHDLRGPLGLIVQSVNMIKQDPSLTRRMLQLVEENAVRSLKMIADWRSSTREIVPHPTKTDLGGLIKSVLEGSTIPSSVAIVTSFGAGLDSIMIDSDIMHRIMDNLVKNAVEAMPEGGKLSIRAEKEGDDIVINVGDTGVGIPEESKGRIFSPLYTTKAGGMGLGLTYCRRAVETQGGSIDFESKVGAGTNFTIKLPLDPNISF